MDYLHIAFVLYEYGYFIDPIASRLTKIFSISSSSSSLCVNGVEGVKIVVQEDMFRGE